MEDLEKHLVKQKILMPSLKCKNKATKTANSGDAVDGSLDTEEQVGESHVFVRYMLYLLLQSCHYSVLHETQDMAEHDCTLSLVKQCRDR